MGIFFSGEIWKGLRETSVSIFVVLYIGIGPPTIFQVTLVILVKMQYISFFKNKYAYGC